MPGAAADIAPCRTKCSGKSLQLPKKNKNLGSIHIHMRAINSSYSEKYCSKNITWRIYISYIYTATYCCVEVFPISPLKQKVLVHQLFSTAFVLRSRVPFPYNFSPGKNKNKEHVVMTMIYSLLLKVIDSRRGTHTCMSLRDSSLFQVRPLINFKGF